MKELSIEEKARRYDEAIEIAIKHRNNDGLTLEQYETIDIIFPELSESEDERIRKAIIQYIKTGTYHKDWIAWLEKQSKPQVRTGFEWVNTIDDACDKRYSEEYTHGEYCHEQSFKWGFQEGVDWLEKQGEKPDYKVETKFKQGDIIKEKETGNLFYVNSIEDFGYTLHYKNCTTKGCTMDFKYEDNYELVEQASTWKPTDEQMKALSNINVTGGISYAGQGQELINLYNELKKLKS